MRPGVSDDLDRYWVLVIIGFVWSFSVVLLPILYGLYAVVTIYKNGYIPPVTITSLMTSTTTAASTTTTNNNNNSDRALRELALYFGRIILVYFGFWVPGIVLTMVTVLTQQYWWIVLASLLFSVQPLVTFAVILTKTDVRRYIRDLVTLSYLFGEASSEQQKQGSLTTHGRITSTMTTTTHRGSQEQQSGGIDRDTSAGSNRFYGGDNDDDDCGGGGGGGENSECGVRGDGSSATPDRFCVGDGDGDGDGDGTYQSPQTLGIRQDTVVLPA